MVSEKDPTLIGNLKRDFGRAAEHPVFRYFQMYRNTKKSYRKMFKGLLRSLKGIAYILILMVSLGEFGDMPIGMALLTALIGLKGIYNLIKGTYQVIRARYIGKRGRGKRQERKWRYFFAWTNTTFLIVLLSMSFLFIAEQLTAPYKISGDRRLYIWPLIYFGIFIIWSIAIRSMVLSGARAFKVGDKLARLNHDRKLLRKNEGRTRRSQLLLVLTGYIPVIWLALMIMVVSLLKLLLRFLTSAVFDVKNPPSIGEELIRYISGSDISLATHYSFFSSWYGPLLFYLGVVLLMGIFSNLRTRAMLSTNYRDTFQSDMGRRIGLVKELKGKKKRG